MTEKIYIFDTTLRDGEQSPGASMNLDEKIQIAEKKTLNFKLRKFHYEIRIIYNNRI